MTTIIENIEEQKLNLFWLQFENGVPLQTIKNELEKIYKENVYYGDLITNVEYLI